MATKIAAKKKCEFWERCYRMNKNHLDKFMHPRDETEEKKIDKPVRLVHNISIDDNDPDPSWKTAAKRKIVDKNEESKSPSKVAKLETEGEEEKITVSYNQTGKTKLNKTDDDKAKETNDAKPKEASKSESSKAGDISSSSSDEESTSASPSKKNDDKSVVQYSSKKDKCKYWDKCYQTTKSHRQQFYHPGDKVPEEKPVVKKTREQTNTALNSIDDGQSVEFDSGYKLKRDGDIYSCSCKGFLVQRAPINERTCKHLKEYLGEDFEKTRVATNTKPKAKHIKSHISISLLLAHKYDEKTDPVGWWISEKLDGVRAYWNGNCFYSRLGNAFYAPHWFTKDLPKDMTLDGELFGGRGQFQSTVSIVKTAESPKWKDIKYHVFDSPDMKKETFEKRMDAIKKHFEEVKPSHAIFVDQVKCTSKEQLDARLTKVLNYGGEGLMIRQPNSVYERTRSKTLLKIKKFYDAEAVVIAHEKGKGVNSNRCGALRCRMACGKEFSVGSGLTDKNRNKPPKIGSIITYKFQELSKSGSPRFPTFVGIRIDMTEPKDAEIREVLDEDDA